MAEFVVGRLRLGDPEVAIVLIGDRAMKRLNGRFRGQRKTTDVLSFPKPGIRGHLGDVFISLETADANARLAQNPLQRETAFLVLHGVLHLAGYDHEVDEGQMVRLERRLRRAAIFSRGHLFSRHAL